MSDNIQISMTNKTIAINREFWELESLQLREWRELDPITRAEHILSNSPVYRRILYLENWQSGLEFICYDHLTDQFRYRVKD